jgi:tryptophan synthase alpha chain
MKQCTVTGVSAITQAFAVANTQGRPTLLTYLTLGYPTREASLELIPAMQRAGADIIELGAPFSDPIADGPTIQAASQVALQAGITPGGCLSLAAELREQGVSVPFVMMGYYNPILSYGPTAYARDCASAGIDGLIVPDLPPEEAGELSAACQVQGLALIYLVAPNTSDERLRYLAASTTGFLYVVSRLGTTGSGQSPTAQLTERLEQVRQVSRTPVAVGFGISRPEHTRALVGAVDGVIVGSAVVERAPLGVAAVERFVGELRRALEPDTTWSN